MVLGGEELIHGEFDVAENLTGVILAAAAGALLVGHAVIIHRHQKLSLALQANDGELTQGDIDPLAFAAEAQVAAEAGADAGRDLGELAVTGTALADVHQLHIEHDGIYGLHNSGRQVALADVLLVQRLKGGFRAENLGVTLAAEENDALVKNGKAADLHRTGGAHKGIRGYAVEIADVYSIEAAVKADWFHIDVHVQQLRGSGLDADGAVNGALRALRGVEAKIFDTVLITAAIINLFRVYAHGLPDTGGILHGTGHDLFRHCNTS